MNILKIKKLRLRNVNLLTLIILLLNSNIFAADTYDFAVSLYNKGDYYRAISEFNRYLFFYKKSTKRNETYLYITKSYYYAEQFHQSIENGKKFLDKIKQNYYSDRLRFWLATSYLRIEDFKNSYDLYNYLKSNSSKKEISEYSYYRLIWIPILQEKWHRSLTILNDFQNNYPKSDLIPITDLMKKDINRGIEFTPLSPTLAAGMSAVIPGLGQIYSKRIGDGIVAFSLIAALSYGVYYYYNNGPKEICYSLSLLDIIFYLGNIYTAFGSAHKYNINFNNNLRQEIFNNYFEDYDF